MESSLLFAAERKDRSLDIPGFGVGITGQIGCSALRESIKIRGWPQLQARLQQVAMVAWRRRHALDGVPRFENFPFAQKNRWRDIGSPLRPGIQANKIGCARSLAEFHECPRARSKSMASG